MLRKAGAAEPGAKRPRCVPKEVSALSSGAQRPPCPISPSAGDSLRGARSLCLVLPPAQGLACPTEYKVDVVLAAASPRPGERLPQTREMLARWPGLEPPRVTAASSLAPCLVCTVAEGSLKPKSMIARLFCSKPLQEHPSHPERALQPQKATLCPHDLLTSAPRGLPLLTLPSRWALHQ